MHELNTTVFIRSPFKYRSLRLPFYSNAKHKKKKVELHSIESIPTNSPMTLKFLDPTLYPEP